MTVKFGDMYTYGALNPSAVVEKAIAQGLGARDFESIVGRGLSGALVVPMLATALGRSWAIVRKEGEQRHSHDKIEGEIGETFIFVDDLVASGGTYRAVIDTVASEWGKKQDEWARRRAAREERRLALDISDLGAPPGPQPRYVGAWLYVDNQGWQEPGSKMGYGPY